ncbi:hypothetical protein ACTI_68260 [Actinoplanes sp. OR16]|uniref:sigma-70 family RNA polymerase sigma factor n=1 Tax=Actinoplanes sp. OR16 TaxID=946334 RepID=UPI000F70CB9E|nr:sigma-70 family RNA polymerase sigma factor [Actinoplanes sp. OR16]BBH70141.1 hypothetical protein ACTI_68260 [Actinoplanes sp. OR16]
MKATDPHIAGLVVAAQHGDRRSLELLLAEHLPFVYTIVARAVDSPEDADDVVQDTMLRAVRDLAGLRAPASFKPWLAAIAVRQVGTWQSRRQSARSRAASFDELADAADPGADVEAMAVMRTRITGQRREVAEAARWLDDEDRALLSLWWQETAGLMTRNEVASAIGLGVAHTGVRIQRMREQLDLARAVTAALAAQPICARLAGLADDWNGSPSPLWRKRLARHVRSCPICSAVSPERVPVERLLAAVPALVPPPGLTETILAKSLAATVTGTGAAVSAGGGVAGVKAGVLGAMSAHPVVATIAGVAAAAAVIVPVAGGDGSAAPRAVPQVTAGPGAGVPQSTLPSVPRSAASGDPRSAQGSAGNTGNTGNGSSGAGGASETSAASGESAATGGTVRRGRVSLAWSGGGYVTARETTTATIAAADDQASRQNATFDAVDGLADPGCVSFQTADGRYLRHYELLIYTHTADGSAIFREDATYCPEAGATAGAVTLRSHNYPEFCLRWTGTEFRIGWDDGSAKFRADSSFVVRKPLAGKTA